MEMIMLLAFSACLATVLVGLLKAFEVSGECSRWEEEHTIQEEIDFDYGAEDDDG